MSLALDRLGIDYDRVHLEAIDRLVLAPVRGHSELDIAGARIVRSYDTIVTQVSSAVLVDLCPPAGPYQLRVWEPGDRMRPARLKGRSRKLSDLYIDAKVPRDARASARVWCARPMASSCGPSTWASRLMQRKT